MVVSKMLAKMRASVRANSHQSSTDVCVCWAVLSCCRHLKKYIRVPSNSRPTSATLRQRNIIQTEALWSSIVFPHDKGTRSHVCSLSMKSQSRDRRRDWCRDETSLETDILQRRMLQKLTSWPLPWHRATLILHDCCCSIFRSISEQFTSRQPPYHPPRGAWAYIPACVVCDLAGGLVTWLQSYIRHWCFTVPGNWLQIDPIATPSSPYQLESTTIPVPTIYGHT